MPTNAFRRLLVHGLAIALVSGSGVALAATDNDQGPNTDIEDCDEATTDECHEVTDPCKEAFGPDAVAVYDEEGYDIISCETHVSPIPDPPTNPNPPRENPTPPRKGGTDPTPDDECADPATPCTCDEQPSQPATCDIAGCAECEDQKTACIEDLKQAVNDCKTNNVNKADTVCGADQGAFATKDACISGLVNGAPGSSKVVGHNFTSSDEGGGSISVGLIKDVLGGSGFYKKGTSISDSSGSSSHWPYKPPNLSHYPDCQSLGAELYDACNLEQEACQDSSDKAGESCAQK